MKNPRVTPNVQHEKPKSQGSMLVLDGATPDKVTWILTYLFAGGCRNQHQNRVAIELVYDSH